VSGALKRDEWETVRLGDVCDIYTGTGFPVQYQGEKTGVFPFYKVGDISRNVSGGNVFLGNCDNFISEDVAKILKGTIIPKDTVVFAKIGEAVKLNRRAVTVQDCLVDNNAMGVCPNQARVFLSYFYHYMCHLRLETYAESTTVPSVKKSVIEKIKIPLPPLDIQRQIADTLDKVTELITLRKTQLEKLDELVKARFVEMFGEPKENPKWYNKRQLKETCKVITGNTPSRAVSEYYGKHIEWIKTDNIVSGLINPTTATEFLSEEGMAVGRTVEKDSILMACIAGSLSSIGRVCVTDRKVAFNQQINAIVPNDYNILFLYVLLQISKEYLVEEINMALKGILSKSKLEEKEFIVPPMEVQEEFATFVEQTDKSKVIIQQSLDTLETLKKSLMQEYFG